MEKMTTLKSSENKGILTSTPIRGAGDGMETEEPPKSVEVTHGVQPINQHVLPSPRKKVSSDSPGVLQLGKILNERTVEVEAVRIFVPKAAITHDIPTKNTKVKSLGHHREELHNQAEVVTDPRKELSEVKKVLEKLKNSERRLLQDKEGLSNQLRVQTEINRELKKLLVASVGDDPQYHFERLAREKNQLILENEALGRNTAQLSEQLERMSIQCDVWRSKFLASRVMADELTNFRVVLQRQNRDAQSAIQDLLSEREQFRQEMTSTQKFLEELLVSLQWGSATSALGICAMAVSLLLRGGRIRALKAVLLEARVFPGELVSVVRLSTESEKSAKEKELHPKTQSVLKEPEPTDTTTYKNLQHHDYNTYTFLDLNLDLSKFRLPQPSSGRESPRH